jgi:hypothetical protein
MRIDNRLITAPLFALSFAVACGDSDTVVARAGAGGGDSGVTGGSSTGTGGTSTGTGGRTGSGGRATGGSSGSANGGSSGTAGADASASGGSGDGGPGAGGSSAGGNAGAGGTAAGGAGGSVAGGAGGTAAGGAGGRGAGGRGTGGAPASTACDRLTDCCATVPLAVRTQCTTLANSNNQPQCGVALGIFCPSADAGSPVPQDAANACSALDACCPTAGAQQQQCEQTVAAGNPQLCNFIRSILCP